MCERIKRWKNASCKSNNLSAASQTKQIFFNESTVVCGSVYNYMFKFVTHHI